MQVQERLYTVDDLKNMPDDGQRYELHNGVLIEVAGSKYRQTRITAWIIYLLTAYLQENGIGGDVSAPDGTFVLSPYSTRIPDVGYITPENAQRQSDDEFLVGAPDLTVEVLSPSNTRREMLERVGAYLSAGSQLIWLVDAEARTVEVFGSDRSQRLLTEADTLDGGNVLPGFQLPVAEVFKRR